MQAKRKLELDGADESPQQLKKITRLSSLVSMIFHYKCNISSHAMSRYVKSQSIKSLPSYATL